MTRRRQGEIIYQSPDPYNHPEERSGGQRHGQSGGAHRGNAETGDQERNAAEALYTYIYYTTDLEFEVVWADPVYHDTIEAGRVVSTDPAGGDPLHNGDTVTVVISKGREPKPVTIIPFTEMSIEEATANLEKMGLLYQFEEKSDSSPPGTIFDQSIPAGTQVMEGTSITLYVSTGPLYDPEGVRPNDPEPLPDGGEAGESEDAG